MPFYLSILYHMKANISRVLQEEKMSNFYFIYLFIFGLCWVFVAVLGLSLVAVSRGYSSLWCAGFSCCGAQCLGMWASAIVAHRPQIIGSVVVAHGLIYSVACEIFLEERDNLCLCIGRWILIYCSTREGKVVSVIISYLFHLVTDKILPYGTFKAYDSLFSLDAYNLGNMRSTCGNTC